MERTKFLSHLVAEMMGYVVKNVPNAMVKDNPKDDDYLGKVKAFNSGDDRYYWYIEGINIYVMVAGDYTGEFRKMKSPEQKFWALSNII